ncbi:MAG: Ig-like domain-containing protein [Candidatus Cloacimonetes bacterium]|nr:Ig-like domain-containing protein [Candidatus Cloacimonadota bacterium]
MINKILRVILLLSLLFLVADCGHKKSPTGGEKDLIAPEIIDISPGEFSDLGEGKIEVTFSKPIERNTILTGFYIYPPVIKKKLSWDKNVLSITLLEELQKDSNYFFSFNTSIKGEHDNKLDRDYIFVFRNGKLQEQVISGSIVFELPEDASLPVNLRLFSYDSLFIFRVITVQGNYRFENLNAEDHILKAYVDKDGNGRFDYESEPYTEVFIPAREFSNIDLEMTYQDTLRPEMISASVPSSTQINVQFSESVASYEAVWLFTADSLSRQMNIKADYLNDDRLLLVTEPLDTLRYRLEIIDLYDLKGNLCDKSELFLMGSNDPDRIPPRILSHKPRNGATVDILKPEIETIFSEIIFPENIQVSLKGIENEEFPELTWKRAPSLQFSFQPAASLRNYASYEFRISGADPAGNAMTDTLSIVFIPVIRQ